VRVENTQIQQSLIDSPKPIENKELKSDKLADAEQVGEAASYIAYPLGSSGTYSPASLRAAVDYHAKFLTVAGINMEAANHAATIPRAILDRFSGR
jgi:hypothetical protein